MTTQPDVGQALPASSLTVVAALSAVARAAEELRATGTLEVGPFLAAYRALEPVAHGGSANLAPDLDFLNAATSLGEALLDAELFEVTATSPRAPPSVTSAADTDGPRRAHVHVAPGFEATADALALALGLGLEAAKLQALLDEGLEREPLAAAARALGVTTTAIAEHLATDEIEVALRLRRVADGGVVRRVLASPAARVPLPIDDVLFDVATGGDGPLFVLAGATERLQDILSPWVRRLDGPLSRLAGTTSSDDLYSVLPLLLAEEPLAHDERLDVESREGFTPCGGVIVIRFDVVDPTRADERARPLLRALKQSRARAVLCERHPSTLTDVLARVGKRARVVAVLAEALGGRSPYPDVVVDALTGHPLDLDNALADPEDPSQEAAVCISPPSLGLSPRAFLEHGVGCAPLLAPFLLEAAHARAAGLLARRARLAAATFAPGDSAAASAVALRCLSRMAGVSPLASRRQPARRP